MILWMICELVDDLFGVTGSIAVTNETCVSAEIFEKKTRLNYKLSKCKVIIMNSKLGGSLG